MDNLGVDQLLNQTKTKDCIVSNKAEYITMDFGNH